MSKRRKLILNIILIAILILLALVSTLLYINYYPRVSVHLISDNELLETIEIKKNSSIPALMTPEKEGHNFEGWYHDQDYKIPFIYGKELSKDVELYAKYSAIDYTLTYNYGDIKDIYPACTQHYYDAITLPSGTETILIEGSEVTLATLKEGYKFVGWSPAKNSTIAAYGAGSVFLMPSSNVNLYAVWEPIPYSINYYIQDLDKVDAVNDVDANGFVTYSQANQSMHARVEYKYGTKITAPEVPVHNKGYYQFVGWFEDPYFQQPINFNQFYMGLNQISNINLDPVYDTDNTDQIKLYAKWQVVRFNISFCLNSSTRVGTTYLVPDSSIMVKDANGSYANSNFFVEKKGVYFNLPLMYLDGGLYPNELLENQVCYSVGTSKGELSHRFVGWYTMSTIDGKRYTNETEFNPADFPRSYDNRDEGFSFLEPGVETYVLYAVWEEYLHIEYNYNGTILGRQPVVEGAYGQLSDPALMNNVKRTGYHFIGWSKTSDALTTGDPIYRVGQPYKFTTVAAESQDPNCIFFSVSNRKTVLYPVFMADNYNIKYEFSINTLGDDGKLNTIVATQPTSGIEYTDYLKEKLLETFTIRYNTTVDGRIESHTVLNAIDADGKSNAVYSHTNGEVYLLLSWAVVDENNNVVYTYEGGNSIYVNTSTSPVYKYSQQTSVGNHEYTLKAIWTTQMTISFDKSWPDVEGTLPENLTGMTGSKITLPGTPSLTRPYHTFRGWVTESERLDGEGKENYNPTTIYLPSNTYAFSENTTLYALWEPIEYRLIVQNTTIGGGVGSQIASISLGYGEYKNLVAKVKLGPTLEIGEGANLTNKIIPSPQTGWSLVGFSTSAGGDVEFENGDIITVLSKLDEDNLFNPYPVNNIKSYTIFAKYEIKTYDVVIDNNGTSITHTVPHDTLLRTIMPTPNVTEGHRVKHWEIKAGADTLEIENIGISDYTVGSDLEVKLVLEKLKFAIMLQKVNPLNGNIIDVVQYEAVEYGSTLGDVMDAGDDSHVDYFGYNFDAWYLGETKIDDLASYVVESNLAFITKYTPEKVYFVYHANKDASDTTTVTSEAFDYSAEVILPSQTALIFANNFTKDGYILQYWYLDSACTQLVGENGGIVYLNTNKFDQSLFKTITGQEGYYIDLYAGYARQYTVSFEFPDTVTAKGNTSARMDYVEGKSIDVGSVVNNNNITLTVHSGYEFKGYWYVKGIEDVKYNQNEKTEVLINSDIILCPVVENITYTATFNYSYTNAKPYNNHSKQENVKIGDTINLPSETDLATILKSGGVSYRALSWCLQGVGKTYNLGQSITLTGDMLFGYNIELSFVLVLQSEISIKYNPSILGLNSVVVNAIIGEEITIGYDSEGNRISYGRETTSDSKIVAWASNGQNYTIGQKMTVSNSTPTAFTAVWEKKQINIIYNSNYPVSGMENKTATSNTEWGASYTILSQNWTCETGDLLYVITAWNTSVDGTGTTYNINETITLNMEGDYNLYAVWTRAYKAVYRDGESTHTGVEQIMVGVPYTLIKTSDVTFTKDGHYIAKWSYNGQEFDPTVDDLYPSKAIILSSIIEGKYVYFDAVWSADELDVTIVYTNADGSQYNQEVVDTAFGTEFVYDFDTTRKTLTYDGYTYRFAHFVDGDNVQYALDENNRIVIASISKRLVLTTVYVKEVTLTYRYGSDTETLTFDHGTVIGHESFKVFTDEEMISMGEGKVKHIGWTDNTNNYTFITDTTANGYNYVVNKGFAKNLTLDTNIVLELVTLNIYSLTIYDDIQYNKNTGVVSFTTSNNSITLVEDDTYELKYNEADYKGFVVGGADFSYDITTEADFEAKDTFTLTSDIVTDYNSDKNVYLYPLQYVDIKFIGVDGAEEVKTILAGDKAAPSLSTSDTEKKYFDKWILEETGEEIDFSTEQVFYEDTIIRAVYKDFFSVQYRDSIPNNDLLNNTTIKAGESVTLAGVHNVVNGVEVNYVKEHKELVGWYICYSIDGFGGDYYPTPVELGSTFNPSQFAEDNGVIDEFTNSYITNFYIFPYWMPELIDVTFASNPNADEFDINANGTYQVEYDETVSIAKGSDKTQMTITFTAVTVVEGVRSYNDVTITVIAKQTNVNYTLSNWHWAGSDGEFDMDQASFRFVVDGTISFTYTTNPVNLQVFIKYAGTDQSNIDNGYFTVGTDITEHYAYEGSGTSGEYDIILTSGIPFTSVATFNGWYLYDKVNGTYTKIENGGVYSLSSDGTTLTITNLKDDSIIYADFSAGFITLNQTNTYRHIEAGVVVNTGLITSLTASYTNVEEIDGVEYSDNAPISITGTRQLSVDFGKTITLEYNVNSTSYNFYGILVTYTLSGGTTKTFRYIDDDNDNVVSFTVDQVVEYNIQIIVVESSLTVTFKGYNNAVDLFTKSYEYGAKIGEIGIPSTEGANNDYISSGITYTFNGWTYNDVAIDRNMTITRPITINSNWIRVYDVTFNTGNGEEVRQLIYSNSTSLHSSLSGAYHNMFDLDAIEKENYNITDYIFSYNTNNKVSIGVADSQFSLFEVFNSEALLDTVTNMKLTPVYTKEFTITVYDIDGNVRDTIHKSIDDQFSYAVEQETGYDFINWTISYDGKTKDVLALNEGFALNSIDIIDENDTCFVVNITPNYSKKTFNVVFQNNDSARGTTDAESSYTLNYDEVITFTNNLATFTTSAGVSKTVTATPIGAYQFRGFNTVNSDTIFALADYKVVGENTGDTITIYAIFTNAVVNVKATLSAYVNDNLQEIKGGTITQIIEGEDQASTTSWDLTLVTGYDVEFKVNPTTGYQITSVKYKQGSSVTYATLTADGDGIYSFTLVDVCDIQVRFDAIKYDVNIAMGKTDGLEGGTPYAYYGSAKELNSTTAVKVLTDAYSTTQTLLVYANTGYYQVDKITYTVDNGTEYDFATTSQSGYSQSVDADKNYTLTFSITGTILIKVYVEYKEVSVYYYGYQDELIPGATGFRYNQTIKGTDITKTLSNYYYNASMQQTTIKTDAVGGYRFEGWLDAEGELLDSNYEITLTGDINLYVYYSDIYFVKTVIDSTYVSGGYSNNQETTDASATNLGLFTPYVPANVVSSYNFIGYEYTVNGSTASIKYSAGKWYYSNTVIENNTNTTELATTSGKLDFGQLLGTATTSSSTQIVLNGKFEYKAFTLDFAIATDSKLGVGEIVVDDVAYETYSQEIEYGYKFTYTKAVYAGVQCNVVSIYDRNSALVETVYFKPASACVIGDMYYRVGTESTKSLSLNASITITKSTLITCEFQNSTAYVTFKFEADANLTDANVVTIKIENVNDGISQIKELKTYNHTLASPTYTEYTPTFTTTFKYGAANTTAIMVGLARTHSFKYTITVNSDLYEITSPSIVSETMQVDANEEIVFTIKLKQHTISFQNCYFDGTNNQNSVAKGYAILNYKVPDEVSESGIIKSFKNATIGSDASSTGVFKYDNIAIYYTDAPYFTAQEVTGYRLDNIYTAPYSGISTPSGVVYDSANNHYNITLQNNATYYATFVEKGVTFTFVISNGTQSITVATKDFKSTQYLDFYAYVSNLTTVGEYSLNEYLITHANKAYFKNVWVTQDNGLYWDITHAYANADKTILSDSDMTILAHTTTSYIVEVKAGSNGAVNYYTSDANNGVTWLVYSVTASGENYSNIQFKVVAGNSIPRINAMPDDGYRSDFNFANISSSYTNVTTNMTSTNALKVEFYEITINIAISIQPNIYLDGNKISVSNFTFGATKTFSELYAYIKQCLANKYGSNANYDASTSTHYVYRDNTEQSQYYALASQIFTSDNTPIIIDNALHSIFNGSETATIVVKYETVNKVALSIQDSDGDFVSTMYYVKDTTVDLSSIKIVGSGNVEYTLGTYAYSHNMGQTGKYYSHLSTQGLTEGLNSPHTSRYLEYLYVTSGERKINDSIKNTSIEMSADTTLYVVTVPVITISIYLDGINNDTDAVLTEKGIGPNNVVVTTAEYFEGKKVEENSIRSAVSNYLINHNLNTLFGIDSVAGTWNKVVTSNTTATVNVVVQSSVVTSKITSSVNEGDYDATIGYVSTVSPLGYFNESSSDPYYNNTMPYIIVDGAWVENPNLPSDQTSVWVMDGYTFVGYRIDGTSIILGTRDGSFKYANGTTYTIVKYDPSDTSKGGIDTSNVKNFVAMYISSYTFTFDRTVTNYVDDVKNTTYDLEHSKYGYGYTISYEVWTVTDGNYVCEKKTENISSIDVLNGKILSLNTSMSDISFKVHLAPYYRIGQLAKNRCSVLETLQEGVANGNTWTIRPTSTGNTTSFGIGMWAYYYTSKLPSSSDYDVSYDFYDLEGDESASINAVNSYIVPRQIMYNVTTTGVLGAERITYTEYYYDPNLPSNQEFFVMTITPKSGKNVLFTDISVLDGEEIQATTDTDTDGQLSDKTVDYSTSKLTLSYMLYEYFGKVYFLDENGDDIYPSENIPAYLLRNTDGDIETIVWNSTSYDVNSGIIDDIVMDYWVDTITNYDEFEDYSLEKVDYTMTDEGPYAWLPYKDDYGDEIPCISTDVESTSLAEIIFYFTYVPSLAEYEFEIRRSEDAGGYKFIEGDVVCSDTTEIDGAKLVDSIDVSDDVITVSGYYTVGCQVEIEPHEDYITINFRSAEDVTILDSVRVSFGNSVYADKDSEYFTAIDIELVSQTSVNKSTSEYVPVTFGTTQIGITSKILTNDSGKAELEHDENFDEVVAIITTRVGGEDNISFEGVMNFRSNEEYLTPVGIGTASEHGLEIVENIDYFNVTEFINNFNTVNSGIATMTSSNSGFYQTLNGEQLYIFNGDSITDNSAGDTWYTLRGLMYSATEDLHTFGYSYYRDANENVVISRTEVDCTSEYSSDKLQGASIYLVLDTNSLYGFSKNISESTFIDPYTKSRFDSINSYNWPYAEWQSSNDTVITEVSGGIDEQHLRTRFPVVVFENNYSSTTPVSNSWALNEIVDGLDADWGNNGFTLTLEGLPTEYSLDPSYNSTKNLSYSTDNVFRLQWVHDKSTVIYLGNNLKNYDRTFVVDESPNSFVDIHYDAISNSILKYQEVASGNFTTIDTSKLPSSVEYTRLSGAYTIKYWSLVNPETNTVLDVVAPGKTISSDAFNNGIIFVYGVYGPDEDLGYTYNNSYMWSYSDNHTLSGYNAQTSNTSLKEFFNGEYYKSLLLPEWRFKVGTSSMTASNDGSAGATKAYKITSLSITNTGYGYDAYFGNHLPSDIEYVYIPRYITNINNATASDGIDTSTNMTDTFENITNEIKQIPLIAKLTWTHKGAQNFKGYIVDKDNTYFESLGSEYLVTGYSGPSGIESDLLNGVQAGYLMNEGGDRLYHCPPNFAGLNSGMGTPAEDSYPNTFNMRSVKHMDAFAFAYKQKMYELGDTVAGGDNDMLGNRIYLPNIQSVGTATFYESDDRFAQYVEFADTLTTMGFYVFEGKGESTSYRQSITFYGHKPTSSNLMEFIGRYSLYGLLFKGKSTNLNLVINIYAMYYVDNTYNCPSCTGSYTCIHAFGYEDMYFIGLSDSLKYYRYISAPTDWFEIDGEKILGFSSEVATSEITSSKHCKHLVLPYGYEVEYIGDYTGRSAFNSLSFNSIYFDSAMNMGSVLNNEGSTLGYVKVTNLKTAINMGVSVKTLGDGKYSPFADGGVFGVTTVELPHIGTVLAGTSSSTNNTITSIALSNVHDVGNYSFYNHTALKTVTSPILAYIGNYAFANCTSLTSLGMGDTLDQVEIDNGGLTGAHSLGAHFAENTKLTSVSIQTNVILVSKDGEEGIGNPAEAFYGMNSLTTFNVYSQGKVADRILEDTSEIDGLIFFYASADKSVLFWSSLVSGSFYSFMVKVGNGITGDVTINTEGSVIFDRAFEGSQITNLTFSYGSGDLIFGQNVFKNSSIQNIYLNSCDILMINVTNLSSYQRIVGTGEETALSFLQKMKGTYVYFNYNESTTTPHRSTNDDYNTYTFKDAKQLKGIYYLNNRTPSDLKFSNLNIEYISMRIEKGMLYNYYNGSNYGELVCVPEANGLNANGDPAANTINDNTVKIHDHAFRNNTGLLDISGPFCKMTSIPADVFAYAVNLEGIRESSTISNVSFNKNYFAYDGLLFRNSGSYIYLRSCPPAKTGSVDLISTINNLEAYVVKTISGIDEYGLYDNHLSVIKLPETLEYINSVYASTIFYRDTAKTYPELTIYCYSTMMPFENPTSTIYFSHDSYKALGLVSTLYLTANPNLTENKSCIIFGTTSKTRSRMYGFYTSNPNISDGASSGDVLDYTWLYKWSSRTYGSISAYITSSRTADYYCAGCARYYAGSKIGLENNLGLVVGKKYYGNYTYYYCKNCVFTKQSLYGSSYARALAKVWGNQTSS